MSSAPGWKRIYGRLRTMSRAEIVDRVRQQGTARLDWLRYKAGLDLSPHIADTVSAQPHFFFEPQAVPALCSKLRELFPESAEQIVQRAERICQHRFDLLGYENLDYGAQIDWHSDRVHGKRAPRKQWFKIKYLDFEEVGDSKVTWELNRHQHFVTLAKAFRLTGDVKFASELFAQWHHWHSQNSYPVGINWASSLEVAFRSLSWLWTYFLMADSPAMPSTFRQSWLRSMAISGRHIETYLSTYFSPNTHLLGEAVALFFIGTLCPEIPSSRRWQQRGWRIVQQEAVRQVRADGLHFEQSTYYHVYALDFFLHSAILASLNQIEVPKEFDRILERMLDILAALARPGIAPAFGDDDGGRLFDPSRNRIRYMTDPLSTGAVLFGRGDFKMAAGAPTEEMLWLLGESGIDEFQRICGEQLPDSSAAFRTSGIFLMSGKNRQWQLAIDAGPQGAHTAGHGHADALSLTLTASGRELLIDSGTCEYVGPDSQRDQFRGTRAHNTLMIGGADQARPRGPFGWERLTRVQAEGWIAGKTFDLFVGSHDGYSQLPNPVTHRRFVFALKSGLFFVRDLALGFGEYPLDLFWHMGQSLREEEADLFVAEGAALRFMAFDSHGWSRKVEEQFHSPAYGVKERHSVLHFSTRAQLPAEFVTIIVAMPHAQHPKGNLKRIETTNKATSVIGYRYRTATDEHSFYFGDGQPWKMESWSTDAEVFYFSKSVDAPSFNLACCNATYVDWESRRIVAAKTPVLRIECTGSDPVEVVSSDPESVTVDQDAWKALIDALPMPVKAT